MVSAADFHPGRRGGIGGSKAGRGLQQPREPASRAQLSPWEELSSQNPETRSAIARMRTPGLLLH